MDSSDGAGLQPGEEPGTGQVLVVEADGGVGRQGGGADPLRWPPEAQLPTELFQPADVEARRRQWRHLATAGQLPNRLLGGWAV